MGIIIDSREPTKFREVLTAKGLIHTVQQLETGDVVIFNDNEPEHHVVIERKRLDDLLSSYYQPRMAEQFERLSDQKFAILIITGNLEDVLKKIPFNVMTQIVEEIISMAVIQYNFRSVVWMIDKVADVHHSGFVTMIKCIQKVIDGQLDAVPQKKVVLSKDLRVNTIRQLFGLSANVAKNLLREHGTVRKILNLADSDLLKVKGIGPTRVKTIRYILDESINRGNFKEEASEHKCEKCGGNMTLTKMPGGNVYICKRCIGSLT